MAQLMCKTPENWTEIKVRNVTNLRRRNEKTRFTEEQIVRILQEADKEKPYRELARGYGVHAVTISN